MDKFNSQYISNLTQFFHEGMMLHPSTSDFDHISHQHNLQKRLGKNLIGTIIQDVFTFENDKYLNFYPICKITNPTGARKVKVWLFGQVTLWLWVQKWKAFIKENVSSGHFLRKTFKPSWFILRCNSFGRSNFHFIFFIFHHVPTKKLLPKNISKSIEERFYSKTVFLQLISVSRSLHRICNCAPGEEMILNIIQQINQVKKWGEL